MRLMSYAIYAWRCIRKSLAKAEVERSLAKCTSDRFVHIIKLVGLTRTSMALIRSGHGKIEGLNNTEPRPTGSLCPLTSFWLGNRDMLLDVTYGLWELRIDWDDRLLEESHCQFRGEPRNVTRLNRHLATSMTKTGLQDCDRTIWIVKRNWNE